MIKKDQLILYAVNHRGVLANTIVFASAFLGLRHYMYGWPKFVLTGGWSEGLGAKPGLSWCEELALLVFCVLMLWRQRALYSKLAAGKFKESDCWRLVAKVCINKVAYLVPWLIFMFMPLMLKIGVEGQLYLHILGYGFVFALTAANASASAPVLPLLIFDIAIPGGFALLVTMINYRIDVTAYIGGTVGVFCVYAFFIGEKIRQSTLQLIESKIQMQQSARRADEANRAKSSFLALMSHEIRTPMTGIFGMIDFLRETNLTNEQKEFVVTIRDCSKTLLNTLNDILDFSKIESGKLTISKINFNLHAVLENSARILREIAGNKGLELIIEIDPTVPQMMHSDPHRLQQIVMNLVNNAVKFTERGSVELKAFYMETEQPRIHIEVRDTGIGISKDNISKLFSAFSQADESIARKYGGSGLGLSITRSLIKMLGGRIDVMSEEGKGSTFWFEIPYEPPVQGAKSEEEAKVPEAPPQNILVAEDNPVNARIITRMLTHKGHKCTVAPDGDAAIKLVQEGDYDLVFMDVNMPGRNGYDTTRAIQALGPKYKKIPIIGLSANILEESVKKCYEAGMQGHIGKPFAPKDIYAAIAGIATGKGKPSQAPQAQTPAPAQPPAPVSQSPPQAAPLPRKPVVVKTMAEVQAAIADEMGPAYLKEMVEGNIKEAARLMDHVQKEFAAQDYTAVGKSAHDLKSISGLIGMQKTSQAAAAIEQACLAGEHALLGESIAHLDHLRKEEGQEAERLARGEPQDEKSSRFMVHK